MSRNSSVRSSFSCKSEEDFRDEIMNLKRQLTRMKEESKLLKVKLRRSEENAARKEKIICTMIDPMKAHLPAKRDHNKISQVKKSSVKPISMVHSQSLCSRAYRHDFSSRTDSNSRMISSAGQQRRNLKKKGNMKVTSVECLSPFCCISSKSDLLLCNKCGENFQNSSSGQRTVNTGGGEIMNRNFTKNIKGRECDKIVIGNIRSSNKRKKLDAPKNKRSEYHARESHHRFYSGSKSLSISPSFPCDLTENKGNSSERVEMKHGVKESSSDYIICEQCRLRSLQKETSAKSNFSLENLQLEGKKFVSLWNDNGCNNNKQIDIPQVSENQSQDDSCGHSKLGIYLLSEGEEQKNARHNETCVTQVGDDKNMKYRRESIFRVDIKKKELKEENDNTEGMDLYHKASVGDKKGAGNEDTYSFENNVDLKTEGEDLHGVSDSADSECSNLIEIDQMMDSLSIIEESESNCFKNI